MIILFLSVSDIRAAAIPHEHIDGVELRLDLFHTWNLPLIRHFLSTLPYKILLTLRGQEDKLSEILSLKPPFCDLDYNTARELLITLMKNHPDVAFILSYHDCKETPLQLDALYESMRSYPAFCYKIAAMTHSTLDALRLLLFAKHHARVSAICMGEAGSFARVLGPIVGNPIDYASLSKQEQTAPGQLPLSELYEIYHYSSLNKETILYGLIGDPVEASQGHVYHNRVFKERGLNAVYVKMRVTREELPTFFTLAKQLGFRGLSVTMPLKELVLPYVNVLDEKTKKIGAVNTLLIQNETVYGTNTDGIGALDAIEKKMCVKDRTVVLIGAGGAARAIGYEALIRGAYVHIASRSADTAKQLATSFGCTGGGLSSLPTHYDIIIHCAPESSVDILPGCLAMDIVYIPRETPFIQQAHRKGCSIIYGEEMFLNQAALQTAFWISS